MRIVLVCFLLWLLLAALLELTRYILLTSYGIRMHPALYQNGQNGCAVVALLVGAWLWNRKNKQQ